MACGGRRKHEWGKGESVMGRVGTYEKKEGDNERGREKKARC